MTRELIDCLVMSGGGSKGAYSAGVAKALSAFRRLRNAEHGDPIPRMCYVGTSAGALNATVLAAFGPDRLVDMWSNISNAKILGRGGANPFVRLATKTASPFYYFRQVRRFVGRGSPASVYSKTALRRLIEKELKDLDFAEFRDRANLILCATNISTSSLAAFYVSRAMDAFIDRDRQNPIVKRRTEHFVRITDKEMLVNCLLASAAIPIAFPPVCIDGKWYIDGGMGNNIPTREAAYFLRFTSEYPALSQFDVNEAFCVKLDSPLRISDNQRWSVFQMLWRSYEVFEYVHMGPILAAWQRINKEVAEHEDRARQFIQLLDAADVGPDERAKLRVAFLEKFGRVGGSTSRKNVNLIEIAPSDSLGSFLDFNGARCQKRMRLGYTDCVEALSHRSRIDSVEAQLLLNNVSSPVES